MTRLRWLTIALPVTIVGLIELLSDTLLDPFVPFPVDTVLVMLVVGIVAATFSSIAFRRIDRLSADLRTRNAELEARDASLRALQDTSVAISTLTELDPILRLVVETARDLLQADLAFILTTDPGGETRLGARSGADDLFAPGVLAVGAGPGSGSERGVADPTAFVRADRIRATVGVPVRRGDLTIGTLAVGSTRDHPLGDADLETLQALADQAAVAIENDRLNRELRALAVQGERERIARELHDGLAQVLGYVNTKSQAATELLGTGRVPEARTQIDQLAAAARAIYVDVREAILGLSSPVEPSGGLVAAIRDYAGRFAEASKLVVRVEADQAAGSGLAPEVEDDLFRSVREALTNVRKHAEANRVIVRVIRTAEEVDVEVEDDGRGFDPDAVGDAGSDWPHLGLLGMRERATSAGGTVEWRRAGDHGTLVRLTVPRTSTPALPAGVSR
jgi:signal transduction histidine kinase